MVDTTSNPQSGGFDWEDACLDPHHTSLELGRLEGREAGGQAGFLDGQTLGQSKGLEFGLEIGFYRGIVTVLLLNPKPPHTQRIQNSITKLQKALDEFPSPDKLFQDVNNSASSLQQHHHHLQPDIIGNDDHDDEEVSSSRIDILNKMQKIRAYYKLVMVQMGKPQLSLKSSLERPTTHLFKQEDGNTRGENTW